MSAGLSHQLQSEPETEQPEGEDSAGWSSVEGQPVGDIAVPLYRKAELCTGPGIQGTKLKATRLTAVRLQQGAAQGFRREIATGCVTYRINFLTGTTAIEKATEQNSISANLIQLH